MSFTLSDKNRKILFIIFILALCVTALLTGNFPLTKLTPYFNHMGMFDWPIFIEAAKRFIDTGNLYYKDLSLYGPNAPIYKFPPLFASVLIQLLQSGVSEASLRYGMGVAHLATHFGAIIICLKLSESGNKFFLYATAFVFVATFEPFIDNFIGLQLEVFILLLLCACMYLLIKNLSVKAGVMVGIAISLKLYPIFFCLYFLLQKQWRGLFGVAAGFILTTVFSIAVIGYEQHWLYYTKIAPLFLFEPIYTSYQNVSINNVFYQLGFFGHYPGLAGLLVFFCGVCILFFYRSKRQSDLINKESVLTAFSLLVSTFVLATKNSWGNYQLLLTLPVITLLGISVGKKYFDRFSIITIVVACVIIFLAPPHRLFFLAEFFHSDYQPSEDLFIYMRALASALIFMVSAKLYCKAAYD